MDLYPLSVDYLYEGMPVNFEIYHYIHKRAVLLCSDIILTKESLFAIRNIVEQEMHVYVKKYALDRLLNDTEYFERAQSVLERYVGYDAIRVKAKNTMDAVDNTGTISERSIGDVSNEIYNTVESSEVAALVQCINGIRNIDEYLYIHSANVAILNGLIAEWLGYDEVDVKKLVTIGYLHDLGKLKIPKSILDKPAKLTELEFSVVKRHPTHSREILINSGYSDVDVIEAVEQHHERQNGSGYPSGLGAGEICEFAKITAISDVYDAMVAKRPYKRAHSPFEILELFSKNAFSELDMRITKTFLERMPQELVGKAVLLSDGTVGKVVYVNPYNYRYPVVTVDGNTFNTNENLYCTRMFYDVMLMSHQEEKLPDRTVK